MQTWGVTQVLEIAFLILQTWLLTTSNSGHAARLFAYEGTPAMVGWSGWRKRAMARWCHWSARRCQRAKAEEPAPQSASTTGVPAERTRDAVLAALQNGDHALEHASADMRADCQAVRAVTQQSVGKTKGGCAPKYASAGVRGLTDRTVALPAPLPPGRFHGKAAVEQSYQSCARRIHIDIRVPDCVQLPCVDIHVPDTT